MAEWFFDNDTAPVSAGIVEQTLRGQPLHQREKEFRSRRQIEEIVPPQLVNAILFLEHTVEALPSRRGFEVGRNETQSRNEPVNRIHAIPAADLRQIHNQPFSKLALCDVR